MAVFNSMQALTNSYGVPVNNIGNIPMGGGGGGINYSTISTLTPQQQQLADMLQKNIQTGTSLNNLYAGQGAQMGSALQNALTANPSASLSPQATADYMNMAVATPLLRQYDQSIMPRLKDAYAAVGALMGSRRGYAQERALADLQTQIASELGKAQLSNQQLSANLSEQMAQRQAGVVNQQQQNMLGYNQLAGQLTGQSWMALQPYIGGNNGLSVSRSFSNPLAGALSQAQSRSYGGGSYNAGTPGFPQAQKRQTPSATQPVAYDPTQVKNLPYVPPYPVTVR